MGVWHRCRSVTHTPNVRAQGICRTQPFSSVLPDGNFRSLSPRASSSEWSRMWPAETKRGGTNLNDAQGRANPTHDEEALRFQHESKRHWLPWMLVLVLTAIAVLAATLGLESDNADGAKPLSLLASAPVTGFGGYTLQSDVDSIEAQWQVPKVLDTSKSGWAATWIGAQAPTGVDSFIQLGIIEESYSYAGSAIELQRPPGVFRGTWCSGRIPSICSSPSSSVPSRLDQL